MKINENTRCILMCIGSPVNCAAIFTLGKAAELYMIVLVRQKHLGETAYLKFELIKTESNTVLRKIN